MPNKDLNHDIVVRALIKAGWSITKKQKYLSIGTLDDTFRRLYIDIEAQHEDYKIVLIEVKGLENSAIHELMQLIGQYLIYREALDYLNNNAPLYVAIPKLAYDSIMQHQVTKLVLQKTPIPFVVYDPDKEELLEWIPPL